MDRMGKNGVASTETVGRKKREDLVTNGFVYYVYYFLFSRETKCSAILRCTYSKRLCTYQAPYMNM